MTVKTRGWRDRPLKCKICKEEFLPITRKNTICSNRKCKYINHYNISKERHTREGKSNVQRKIKRYRQFLEEKGYTVSEIPMKYLIDYWESNQ
jgi:hypothetical protein